MDKDAVDALDDFLDVLRREFRENPEFALRAVKALGGSVEFRGENTANLVNPLELVAANGLDGATQSLASFSATELKKIAKNHGLATPIDVKGKSSPELSDLIVQRAARKIAERQS